MDNCDGNKSVLDACMGKGQDLASLLEYASDSVVSKTILDQPAGTITLFAFDKGQKLSEHTAPFDALVYIVAGKADITISGKLYQPQTGELVIMPANQPHALSATERFKMLLVMIRS